MAKPKKPRAPGEALVRAALKQAGLPPPKPAAPPPPRNALADRADALAVLLSVKADQLRSRRLGDAQRAEVKACVERAWGAFYGWDADRVRRMVLIEAVAHAAAEQSQALELRDADPRWRNVEADVQHIVSQMAGIEPRAEIGPAVEAWMRGRRVRAKSTMPKMWDALARLVHAAGLGRVKAVSLRVDWQKWRSKSASRV
ncbi:MAG: hypothetical protein HS104_14400 [Polyangiaceae bacterium]|nr:hypothetical protein [Polyangiaceae bacterium]MCL4748898.1 hypothetical protein [Myxococcales bacterium]